MIARQVNEIANAILYEGYILYPYRPTALKNRQRFNFGVVVPEASAAGSDLSTVGAQVLVRAPETTSVEVQVRFLHLTTRHLAGTPWEEAIERVVPVTGTLEELSRQPSRRSSSWPAVETGGRTQDSLAADVELSAAIVGSGESVYRLALRITNTTPDHGDGDVSRGNYLKRSLVSTHALLHVEGGQCVSLLDPPTGLEGLVAGCENTGLFPVLVGEPALADTMLASPIILYDYPQIAPESALDFCDGTEIDEMLVLRVLTLTDAEKAEMRAGDPRARRLLEQLEQLPEEHLMRLHGTLRGLRPLDEEHPA
jgi:hypothetical protein